MQSGSLFGDSVCSCCDYKQRFQDGRLSPNITQTGRKTWHKCSRVITISIHPACPQKFQRRQSSATRVALVAALNRSTTKHSFYSREFSRLSCEYLTAEFVECLLLAFHSTGSYGLRPRRGQLNLRRSLQLKTTGDPNDHGFNAMPPNNEPASMQDQKCSRKKT